MSSLTAQQEESLTLFQEVTALQDRPKAIQYLQMSNWNVEQAVNLQMSGALDNTPATSSAGGGQRGPPPAGGVSAPPAGAAAGAPAGGARNQHGENNRLVVGVRTKKFLRRTGNVGEIS